MQEINKQHSWVMGRMTTFSNNKCNFHPKIFPMLKKQGSRWSWRLVDSAGTWYELKGFGKTKSEAYTKGRKAAKRMMAQFDGGEE